MVATITSGPFTIEKKKKKKNRTSELSLETTKINKRIHPVFHISLLEPAPKNATIAKNIEIKSEDDEYEVERILDHKRVNGRPFYLVKWEGYYISENTWEPIANLTGCHQLVKEYQQRQQSRSSPRRKENSSSESN